MELRELVCIGCPLGCNLKVELEDSGEIISVTGNTCPRGEDYARKEITNPTRIVTSTVVLKNSKVGATRLPVKTKTDIPKNKIFDCVKELKNVEVLAPVYIGDVITPNIAGTGVDIVATRNMK